MGSLFNLIVQKLRALFARGIGSALVSGFVLVAMLTMGSKAVSFFKDAFVAHQFGTGDALDAYMLAFGLLSFGAALLGGGLPEAFLPLYADAIHKQNRKRAQRLAVQSSLVHLITLLVVGSALYFLAPWFIGAVTRGFSREKQDLAVHLLRELLPFMVCFGMSYQLSTWLRAEKHFMVATSAPMLIPLTIMAALFAHPGGVKVETLVWGTVVGSALQLALLTIVVMRSLKANHYKRLLRPRVWEPRIRSVIRNTIPYLVAGGIFSSAAVVDQAMASWLAPGSVAVLSYTDKVCGIILALTALPACDVLFPYFADKVARQDWAGVRRQLFTSILWIGGAALPAVVLLVWLAPLVISLLFERGSFTAADTERVGAVLRFAALQIPFYIIGSLASRVVVALQATGFIMVLSAIGLVGNAALNLVLMRTMGAAGIALATVMVQCLSATLGCIFVLRQIRKRVIEKEQGSAGDNRQRIVFLIRDLGYGGAQRQMSVLAEAMAARSQAWDVTVVSFYSGPLEAPLQAAGVKTVCVGKRHRWDMAGFLWRLGKVMIDLRPQVIHGYLAESNLMAVLLKPLCGKPKVIWGVRDSQTDAASWGVLGKLSFWLNRRLARYADLIIANSYSGRAYYVRQGYPTRRFVVVPNGIDTSIYQPGVRQIPEVVTFGLIGRLHPMKDHETFLRAAAEVVKKEPKVRFRILGRGDDAYADGLKKRAFEWGLEPWLSWEEPRQDMVAVYQEMDVVVSSSAYGEGFSNVLGEALACGVPCLATQVGDSVRLLGQPHWTFASGDSTTLAERMLEMIRLGDVGRREIGLRGRGRMQGEFDVSLLVERTSTLIAQLAEGKEPASWKGTVRHLGVITTGLGTGGAEMMLRQLVTGLNSERYVVTVISLIPGGKHFVPLQAAGIEVLDLGMKAGKPSLSALWRLWKQVRRLKPDVLVGWMYHGCLAAWLGRLFLLRPVPLVWNIRQSLYSLATEKRGSAWVIRLLARLSRSADIITYNSQVSARQHEALGYLRRKTRLVPNGFDTDLFQPAPRIPVPGIPDEVPWVGRFGRWTPMKDFSTFLKAASQIHQQYPQAHFLLVGTGVDASNKDLVEEIEQLGLGKVVHLLGERQDVPALTASLSVAVSSSAFGEGFPNVVGEAMASGVPVVATDIGDTAWVMGETGMRVPAKDPEALARACCVLLGQSSAERQSVGLAGRERIVTHFSLVESLKHFDALFAELAFPSETQVSAEAPADAAASSSPPSS